MARDHLLFLYESFPLHTDDTYLMNKLDTIASTCNDKQLKISCWKICFNLARSDNDKIRFQRLCYELDPEHFVNPDTLSRKMDSDRVQRMRAQQGQEFENKGKVIVGIVALGIIMIFLWFIFAR